jgi:hypothetical protein
MKNPLTNWGFFKKKDPPKKEEFDRNISAISPGRVSAPDNDSSIISSLQGKNQLVTPSFRREVIPLIRNLYKVNPDMSIALQDMFKLSNTGHEITFPNNTDDEADKMREHLRLATKRWSMYTSGIDGLVNKMIVQLLVGGAISVEGVPNNKLDGISTIIFVKPESIIFERDSEGVYRPYQINRGYDPANRGNYIKLNPDTYVYAGMYNDTDEPYGIPPFMAALDSFKSQQDMKSNFKNIMEQVGMVGFLEAKMAKPDQLGNESNKAYEARLNRLLRQLKTNLKEGMKEGVVTGYIDDHEFTLNSTTAELSNLNVPWDMNQQSVANGLGVNGCIIGTGNSTEASTGINLSKMISQLKNVQSTVAFVLDFIYSLELRLAGFNNKGLTITWGTTTVTDDVKIQQARQYKIQNCDLLYKAGIISQYQYAWEMGYDSPDQGEPRLSLEDQNGVNNDPQEATKKKQRQDDKNQSARRSRTKSNPNPSRGDNNTKPV